MILDKDSIFNLKNLKRLAWLFFFITLAIFAGYYIVQINKEINEIKDYININGSYGYEEITQVPSEYITLRAGFIFALISSIFAAIYQLIQIFNFKDNELSV